MKRIKLIIVAIPLALLLLFASTYIPHKVIRIEPSVVSKITVFDGSTGKEVEIIKEPDIDHIVSNLKQVTFQKGKPSFFYMGYSFRTTFTDKNGKTIKEIIINSNDRIRYSGFFYRAVDNSIDYDYIERLVRE